MHELTELLFKWHKIKVRYRCVTGAFASGQKWRYRKPTSISKNGKILKLLTGGHPVENKFYIDAAYPIGKNPEYLTSITAIKKWFRK